MNLDLFGNPIPDDKPAPKLVVTPVTRPVQPDTTTVWTGIPWEPAQVIREGNVTTIWRD